MVARKGIQGPDHRRRFSSFFHPLKLAQCLKHKNYLMFAGSALRNLELPFTTSSGELHTNHCA